ncbi:thermostable hemolysin [Pseudoduganella plicata]|uniref:Thermostable hemolysin n=1 Tax=Pseudoduganella plicata TaxID=321984 RepID=A0A4V1ATN8_9BURK|nr:thermostable hemolysin [Pseudoduganella plicata]QBQ36318.1 hypothetical protein E1742_09215 [Pseudoduganella plicata]GGY76137.1 hypothetical protein GCM10007388_05950 [Pseudoduganella plicata]
MFQLEQNGRSLVFKLVGPNDRYYDASVALARTVYRHAYGATIAPRPHRFIVCIDRATDKALACAGLSFGGRAALFSEHYLDRPLEQIVADIFQRDVARGDIAEVTALATVEPSMGTELMRALPLVCWYLGLRGVICTVTAKLRRSFASLKLQFHELAVADAARLPETPGVNWGTYYDTSPVTGLLRVDRVGHYFDAVCGRYNRHLLADPSADGLENVAARMSDPQAANTAPVAHLMGEAA